MKKTLKLAGLLLALVMVLSMMSVTAFAVTPDGSGSITVNVPTASTGEETYNIYEILKIESYTPETSEGAGDGTATYILNDEDWADFLEAQGFELTENTSKGVTYVTEGTSSVDADFAQAALAYAEENNIAPTATDTTSSGTVTFSGLEEGWYLVDSTVGTLCMIDNTMASVTIDDKNDNTPTIEKVVADTATGTGDATANAKMGDTVYFTITLGDVEGLKDVEITDTCDAGLTIDYTSFAVTDDGDALTATTDYTVTETTTGFTLAIVGEPAGDIVVTYSALVNATAATENDNSATVSWGNNNTSTASEATVNTFALDFAKVDEDGLVITGAEFLIFLTADTDEGLDLFYDATLGAYRPAIGDETPVTAIPVGTAKIVGLDADLDYYAEEITTPDGYTSIDGRAELAQTENTGFDTISTGDEYDPANGGTAIENKQGTVLPSTGGMGTTLFIVGGAVLMIAAGVLLIAKKRMAAK